jgi:DNA-binding PadR family transcriptional regulator
VEWVRVPGGDSLAHTRPESADISAFTLPEFLVLAVLNEHEMYGLEIARSLCEHPDFGVPPGNGILYPVLKTLRDGALSARRVPGTPRTYYNLTDQGRARLLATAKRWADLNEAVQSLGAEPARESQPVQPRV